MERRNFIQTTAFLATVGLQYSAFDSQNRFNNLLTDPIKPFLLPTQAPLDHKGRMDIRVWVRSGATNGLFSSVETV